MVWLRHLAKALEERGHRVWVMMVKVNGIELNESSRHWYLYKRPRLIQRTWRTDNILLGYMPTLALSSRLARRIIQQHHIDVVHAGGVHEGFGAALAVGRKTPLVVSVHGDYPTEFRWWEGRGLRSRLRLAAWAFMERMTLRKARTVVTPSDWLRGVLTPRFGKVPSRTIPNGVSLPPVEPVQEVRRRLGLPVDKKVLVTVNHLHTANRARGFELTLEAFGRVLQAEPATLLVVLGGHEEPKLQRAREQAKGYPVVFTGPVAHHVALDTIASADVYLHSTFPYLESFSIANLEAMAFGKPVVAVASGAIPEYLKDGDNGLLVAPNEDSLPESMAVSLLQLLRHPARAAKLGEKARATVAGRYTWQHISGEFERLYMECCRR